MWGIGSNDANGEIQVADPQAMERIEAPRRGRWRVESRPFIEVVNHPLQSGAAFRIR